MAEIIEYMIKSSSTDYLLEDVQCRTCKSVEEFRRLGKSIEKAISEGSKVEESGLRAFISLCKACNVNEQVLTAETQNDNEGDSILEFGVDAQHYKDLKSHFGTQRNRSQTEMRKLTFVRSTSIEVA